MEIVIVLNFSQKIFFVVELCKDGSERDFLAALIGRCIAGHAADVLADGTHFNERFVDHPLVEYAKMHSNLIIAPHIGGMMHESRAATDIFIAQKVARWALEH